MKTCSAIKANGERCHAWPIRGAEFCINHHPDYAADRVRNGQKGARVAGRGRPSAELRRIQQRVESLAEDAVSGELDKSVAAIAGQLYNISRACIRDLVAAREQEELIARLEKLEEAIEREQNSRSSTTRPYRLS